MSAKQKAVVLLSGGLDSSTVIAIVQDNGFDTYALTFRYGQRHECERQSGEQQPGQRAAPLAVGVCVLVQRNHPRNRKIGGGQSDDGEGQLPAVGSVEHGVRIQGCRANAAA